MPDMRAGQLMAALGEVCADLHGRGLWEAEDSEVLEAIWKFRNDFEASAAPAIEQLAATDTAGMYLLKARDPKDFIFTIL